MHIIIQDKTRAKEFAAIFRGIKTFVDDINISFIKGTSGGDSGGISGGGMYVQSMDSSHVMLMEISLPENWFDKYEVSKPVTLGLKSALLRTIMSAHETSTRIEWLHDAEKDDDKMEIRFNTGTIVDEKDSSSSSLTSSSSSSSLYNKVFEIPLIDIDAETLNIPHTDYVAEITLLSEKFNELISEFSNFGDTLHVEISEEAIFFSAKSPESGSMKVQIDMDEIDAFSIQEDESVSASFSLRYLKNIATFYRTSKQITLAISAGIPMRLSYPLVHNQQNVAASGEKEGEEEATTTTAIQGIHFFLAPKLDDNDDDD
jgi:proliferating cell nuclear antigen